MRSKARASSPVSPWRSNQTCICARSASIPGRNVHTRKSRRGSQKAVSPKLPRSQAGFLGWRGRGMAVLSRRGVSFSSSRLSVERIGGRSESAAGDALESTVAQRSVRRSPSCPDAERGLQLRLRGPDDGHHQPGRRRHVLPGREARMVGPEDGIQEGRRQPAPLAGVSQGVRPPTDRRGAIGRTGVRTGGAIQLVGNCTSARPWSWTGTCFLRNRMFSSSTRSEKAMAA